MKNMEIKFLKNSEIDREKWNRAVSNSMFSLTYAYSWYLDSACVYWDAMVNEDYSLIMPLPYYTKFYNLYIYQPVLIPKLGYFFTHIPSLSDIDTLFSKIPKNITQFELILNKFCISRFRNRIKQNFFSLELLQPYNSLKSNYSIYLKTLLGNENKIKDYVISGLSPNEVLFFLNKIKYFSDHNIYSDLRKIISITSIRRLSNILAVYSVRNELIGIGIFIFSAYSADLIVAAALDDDERTIALIIDRFIKNNSGKTLTLNFDCRFSLSATKLYPEFGAEKYYNTKLFYKKIPKIFRFLSKKNNF